ncbi:ECF transporter S component [Nocardioides sambongensis]|uniref:ECF transporter S component n=1 Tax=Nocardioides sambongensis TaxID=2589074 RepID=UPI00112B0C4D|nr:ECF transporter S component [Nocardioides sambongensis]
MDAQHSGDGRGRAVETFDDIAADLARLRAQAGSPSYSELVRRVSALRVDRGLTPEAARPGRSTVYDAFRSGRRRLDATLVRDLALALGTDPAAAERWLQRCREAVPAPAGTPSAEVRPETQPGRQPEAQPETQPETQRTPVVDVVDVADVTPAAGRRRRVLGLLAACLAVNLLGTVMVSEFSMTLYLDMVGTAVAAIVLGPWWGVGVGVGTNLLGVAVNGPASIPFAAVQVVGALLWGYGVRRFGMGRSMLRFLGLNLLVAVACTTVAVPILLLVFGGSTGHGSDGVVAALQAHTGQMASAVLSSNMLTSTSDKLISGFVALTVLDVVGSRHPGWYRSAPRPVQWTVRAQILR